MKYIRIGDWSVKPKRIAAHSFYVRKNEDSISCFIKIYLKNTNDSLDIYLGKSETNCKSDYWDFESELNK
jgi:hypothetical protein